MSKETISDRQGIALIIQFAVGSTFIIGTALQAKQDMWLAILVAIIISLPICFLYARLLTLFPGKDFFDILQIVFGKFIGKSLSIMYIWFAFHLGALVLRNFGEFISVQGLSVTPKIIPMLIFALLCAWGVKEGIELLGRYSSFFIFLVILSICFTFIFLMPKMHPENILPIMYNGIKPVMRGAFSAITFPFAETIIFLMVFSQFKSKVSPYKIYIWGLLISGTLTTIVALRNIMVLETSNLERQYFASYMVVSRLNIGDFLQRLEIIVSIVFLTAGFLKISICLLAATKGIAKLFNLNDYRFLVIPITMLMVNFSYTVYNNIMEMTVWASDIWPYYAIVFQVGLFMPIMIGAEIKARLQKNR